MRRLALVLVVVLAGCEAATSEDISAAMAYCANHDGLNRIPAQFGTGGRKLVVCNDTSEANILTREAAP